MKIFNSEKIKKWDEYSIKEANISSADLMYKASLKITDWLCRFAKNKQELKTFHFFCGKGNNGGDGLLTANLLKQKGFKVKLWVISKQGSKDYKLQLSKYTDKELNFLTGSEDLSKSIKKEDVIIDALFGVGLNRPLNGIYLSIVKSLNKIDCLKIAIDIPSGLYVDKPINHKALFKADFTLTMQSPKLNFFLEDCHQFVGRWELLDIGLSKVYQANQSADAYYVTEDDLVKIRLKRKKFSHKGTYGHSLIVGGLSKNFGCVALAAKAALRAGCGSVTSFCDEKTASLLISMLPELMNNNHFFDKRTKFKLENYNSFVIGPGLGTSKNAANLLKFFLTKNCKNLVLDADALNLLSLNWPLKNSLPACSLLTPHPKEFRRLVGKTPKDSWEEIALAKKFSKEKNIILILKKAHSFIFNAKGDFFISSTGNNAMATAGSGDVLSGMLGSFLAQGYEPIKAAIFGCLMHGLAGDKASLNMPKEAVIASDIIDHISAAFKQLN